MNLSHSRSNFTNKDFLSKELINDIYSYIELFETKKLIGMKQIKVKPYHLLITYRSLLKVDNGVAIISYENYRRNYMVKKGETIYIICYLFDMIHGLECINFNPKIFY